MPRKQHIVLDLTDADNEPDERAIIVEDRIPLPNRYRDLASKYPFERMKPGQSFFVAGDPLPTCRKLCQAVANFKRSKGDNARDFVVRTRSKGQPEHVNALHEVGARCWRVK
jgi:hypothetical protein